jgi:hypothetical protein
MSYRTVVGEVVNFYYQPASKIWERKFRLVLPVLNKNTPFLPIEDFNQISLLLEKCRKWQDIGLCPITS